MRFASLLSIVSFIGFVTAHPGKHEEHGTPTRREFLSNAKRSIADCKRQLAYSGVEASAVERRAVMAKQLKEQVVLRKRNFSDVLAKNHASKRTDVTSETINGGDLFSGHLSCVLQSEVTEGPYWVKGELVRSNIVQNEPGVPLYLDFQFVDVNTCTPIKNVFLDTWHANSTGVYSGVVAQGNSNIDDLTNINNTALRGIQQSDADGVVYFETVVPGHYTGRTNHIHVLASLDATVLPNGTLSVGNVSHVGQVFFDQSLLDLVETVGPYASNTQEVLRNANDGVFAEEAESVDPVVEYILLGDDIIDGVFGWLSIGVNPDASYVPSPAEICEVARSRDALHLIPSSLVFSKSDTCSQAPRCHVIRCSNPSSRQDCGKFTIILSQEILCCFLGFPEL
ncbi:hypothetical protein M422DRAFT_189042 [Sphaerobolus stellatus SS14]|uniref:Intradiol ring-cleavage dioxygenases domain-containing protein n=1 Tax=Sphaerobolus stellatus (strain SS14) TaxID=990650 RepID=A0A0C9THU7_SPHS4|nr:hypothetical protein M422DRAFT_189042 [Sphaerobolus stellatus SS14]